MMLKYFLISIFLISIIGYSFFSFYIFESNYFLRKFYYFQKSITRNFAATEILNFKMFLNPSDEMITPYMLAFHHWEPLETSIIFNNLREGDTFIDAGANVGYYTLLASKKVGPNGHVFSFEPDPENFDLLRKNVILNNLTNVTISNKALADKNGKLKLFIAPKNKGDHSLRDDGDNRKSILVDVISLDNFLNGKKIDFIKIDVQGADGLVIKGAYNSIKANPDILIVTEFNSRNFEKLGTDPLLILDNFRASQFELYNLDEQKYFISKMKYQDFIKKFVESGKETNILLVPRHRAIKIDN